MKPDAYDVWYDSTRGRWIEAVEYRLLYSLLQPEPGTLLLDVFHDRVVE